MNTAIDFQRREKRSRFEPLETGEAVAGRLSGEPSDLRMSLDRILEGLTPKQRSAFVLRDLQGFELREVAEILGCSAITVRVHLHHARREVRERLREEM